MGVFRATLNPAVVVLFLLRLRLLALRLLLGRHHLSRHGECHCKRHNFR